MSPFYSVNSSQIDFSFLGPASIFQVLSFLFFYDTCLKHSFFLKSTPFVMRKLVHYTQHSLSFIRLNCATCEVKQVVILHEAN